MAQGLIGLPAILAALRTGGEPGRKAQFPALAGIPAQQDFLGSNSGDLMPILFGLAQGQKASKRMTIDSSKA